MATGPVERLMVYGTLMRGQRNHRQLAGATFVDRVVTAHRMTLLDLGPYPGVVSHPATSAIHGELWEVAVSHLRRLDQFEGVPGLFRRDRVALAEHPASVWIYLWNRPWPTHARVLGSGAYG